MMHDLAFRCGAVVLAVALKYVGNVSPANPTLVRRKSLRLWFRLSIESWTFRTSQ